MLLKFKEQTNVRNLGLNLKNLFVKQLQHENKIKLLIDQIKNVHVICLCTDITIITGNFAQHLHLK